MNKLAVFVFLAVAICSCYGMADRRSIRSGSEVSAETNPTTADVIAPQDLVAAPSAAVFTGKTGFKSSNRNKLTLPVITKPVSFILLHRLLLLLDSKNARNSRS